MITKCQYLNFISNLLHLPAHKQKYINPSLRNQLLESMNKKDVQSEIEIKQSKIRKIQTNYILESKLVEQ